VLIHEKCRNALRIVRSQVELAQGKKQKTFLDHLTIYLTLFLFLNLCVYCISTWGICWGENRRYMNHQKGLFSLFSSDLLLHFLRRAVLGYRDKRQKFMVSGKLVSMTLKDQYNKRL